jgi:hypothetical protein
LDRLTVSGEIFRGLGAARTVLEIPVSFLFKDAPEPSRGEGGMPQDMIDFMESEEGVRFVAAFMGITDRKMRRGIARLTGRIAEGVQPKASAELLQLREWVDEPADKT